MLRTSIVFLIACLLGIFVQSTVIKATIPSATVPDIILVLVVIIALNVRSLAGLFGSFALGLLADFASGQFIGPNAAASIVVFGLVGTIASRVYADRSFALMILVLLCSIAKSLTVLLMYMLYLNEPAIEAWQSIVLERAVVEAVLSAVVAPLVLKLLLFGKPFPATAFRSATSPTFRWG